MELMPLLLGWETVPRSLSLEGADDTPVREPVTAALVRTPDGLVLLDTGLTPDDPPGLAELYADRPPERTSLTEALRRAGVRPADVTLAAVSHLHLDHTGGLRDLPGVPVYVQRAELEHADGRGVDEGYWAGDLAGVDWRVVDGDASLAPGVGAVATPGHTPGHMSFVVDLPISGRWILACDAVDLAANADLDVPVGPASAADDARARRASHDRLMALARDERARLVPGHCPRTWPELAFRTFL